MPNEPLHEHGDVQQNGDRLMKVRGDYELPRSDVGLSDDGDQVRQFLIDHADELKIPAAATLAETHDVTTPLGRVVRYQQQLDGLPVLATEIMVTTNQAQDRIVQIDLDRESHLDVTAAGDTQITAEEAHDTALAAVGAPKLRAEPPPPTQAYFPGDDGLHQFRYGMFGKHNSPGAFGHAGAHSQAAWADPATGISFSFCKNGLQMDMLADAIDIMPMTDLASEL